MTTPPTMAWASQVADALGDPLLVVAADPAEAGTPRIAFANRALGKLLGRAEREVVGQSLRILAGKADPLEFARLLDAVDRSQPTDLALAIEVGGRTVQIAIVGRPLDAADGAYLVHLRDITQQRALTEAAERVGRRFDRLASLTSDCIYHLRVDPDCRLVLDWTAGAFERLTGHAPAEVEAMGGWSALIEPADRRLVQRRAQRFLAGEDATTEYRIRARSGEVRWLRDAGRPEWDEAHELVTGVLCAARDVTEQHQLEDRLLAEQLNRRALVGLAEGMVCRFTDDGRLDDVVGSLRGELGERLRAGLGRPLEEILGLDQATRWRHEMERVVPGWAPITFELGYPPDDEVAIHRIRCAAAAGGGIVVLIRPAPAAEPRSGSAALSGATPPAEPRSGSAALSVAAPTPSVDASTLRAMLDIHTSPAVLLHPDLTVAELNRATERLTGWQRAATLGEPFVELMALTKEQPTLSQDLARAQAGTTVSASEAWLRLQSGQEGRIVWCYTPLTGGEGEVVGILAKGDALAPSTEVDPEPFDERQRLKAIMDNVADGIVALDVHGRVVSFSRSAEAIFQYRSDEVVGSPADILVVPGGDGALLDLVGAAAEVPGESHELMGRRKGGELIPIEVAASVVRFNGDMLYILTLRDITLRKQTEETIRNLAYHDPLTGLPNRLLFNDRLTQAIERARRVGQQLAVMILDLDRFKLINDSLGLASGDQVLRMVGERLGGAVRKSDTVARLGGDDFLLLLPGIDGAENAAKVAQKLLDAFVPPLSTDDQELHIGASLGITLFPHDGEDAETLIRNADTALYRAKEHARGSYQFYTTDMNATAFERLVLETQLRKALDRSELLVYYQPQVRLDTSTVVGVEALVRWFHSDLGLISPAEFIPLAEETGLILELGRFVLSTACAQVRQWQDQGFTNLRLAVNLSGRQFEQEDLVRSIAQVVEETALDPRDLELELTESSIMRDPDQAVAKLQALDRLGIRLSIDDFGTGYSSLGHLKRFPIKTLKIDQSFIQDITTDANDAAIAQAIIALAESLKLKVIAEGVETQDQLDLLRRYHCDEMQGYLFARPLPPDELLTLLQDDRRLAD